MNFEKCVDFFKKIVLQCLRAKNAELGYPEDEFSIIIMNTFKGQDNEDIKSLYLENNCELVIVPHNLRNKLQLLDTTIKQKSK